jgi:hypothetical protein
LVELAPRVELLATSDVSKEDTVPIGDVTGDEDNDEVRIETGDLVVCREVFVIAGAGDIFVSFPVEVH